MTEEQIKHTALGFLRTYYRDRPRVGETRHQLDNLSRNGIRADGFITFQTDRGHRFEATFEATSKEKAYEVQYKINKTKLIWESIAWALPICVLVFAVLLQLDYFTIGAERWLWAAFGLLSAFLLTATSISSFLWTHHAFRQIYAIEQFKNYSADEQWIVLGEDVFGLDDTKEDTATTKEQRRQWKYYKELKRQCVRGGFGLLIVRAVADPKSKTKREKLEVRQVITPAQIPLGSDRKKVEFVADAQSSASSSSPGQTDFINRALTWQKESQFRYNFTWPLLIILASLIMASILLWREAGKTTEDIKGEKYRNQLRKKKTKDEPGFFLVDRSEIIPFVDSDSVDEYNIGEVRTYDFKEEEWYNKEVQDSLYDLLNPHWVDIPPGEMPRPYDDDSSPTPSRTDDDGYPSIPRKKKSMAPICMVYADWYGKRYILKDGVYKSKRIAQFRITQINKATALAGILRGGCFDGKTPYYIVYVDQVYQNLDEAKTNLPKFDKLLKYKGYSSGDLELLEISVKR